MVISWRPSAKVISVETQLALRSGARQHRLLPFCPGSGGGGYSRRRKSSKGGIRLAPPSTTYCGFGKDGAGRLTPNRIFNRHLAPVSRPGSRRCELHIGSGGANRIPPFQQIVQPWLLIILSLVSTLITSANAVNWWSGQTGKRSMFVQVPGDKANTQDCVGQTYWLWYSYWYGIEGFWYLARSLHLSDDDNCLATNDGRMRTRCP
jgi:hypothetical protein